MNRPRLAAALLCAALLAAARAQPLDPDRAPTPSRWQPALDAFAQADRMLPPAAGGVLFIGSSSIRLWDGLEQQFSPTLHVLKRGFGGSRLADCADLVDRLVWPYRPRQVIVYAGDNDLAEGATPQAVLDSLQRLAAKVHERLPQTRIAFLSVKPSPARAALLPRIQSANELIRRWADTAGQVAYIDVHSALLRADGQPRAELFQPDGLHLNAQGYALWRDIIASHLGEAAAPPKPGTLASP